MNETVEFFNATSSMPPSFQGDRGFYAFSIFGLLGAALLAAEWSWRIIQSSLDKPYPWNAPITIARGVVLSLLAATLCRITPDVLQIMFWPEVMPATRATIARVDRIMDGVALFPMTFAWGLGLFGATVVEFQLIRQPIPGDLRPSWKRVRRPLGIGIMILIIALTLAFLR